MSAGAEEGHPGWDLCRGRATAQREPSRSLDRLPLRGRSLLTKRLRLTGWLAVVVGLGFLGVEAIVLHARIRDYDEGVYWQSIRAMARNEPLFRSVFASQPPVFYETLLPFYWIGHSLVSLRIAVLVLGLAGLGATYAVGRLLSGQLAGLVAVVLVATSPLYLHQSGIVQAAGPAVAIGMGEVALAIASLRADGGLRDARAGGGGVG